MSSIQNNGQITARRDKNRHCCSNHLTWDGGGSKLLLVQKLQDPLTIVILSHCAAQCVLAGRVVRCIQLRPVQPCISGRVRLALRNPHRPKRLYRCTIMCRQQAVRSITLFYTDKGGVNPLCGSSGSHTQPRVARLP